MSVRTLDFSRSYYRFFVDFETREMISLSHKPPTRTNRTRITIESSCRLTHRPTGKTTNYYLSAACKSERVGAGKGDLWIEPNADVIFLLSDDGQFGIYKSWLRNDPGVMRYPESLGPQPERQTFRVEDNFDDVRLDLCEVDATALTDFSSAEKGIGGTSPLVSRIAYQDGDYDVCIDQPVKSINICEKDELFQTDTGPIIVPDLSAGRIESDDLMIGVMDLAYSAWHAADWAEFVINVPTPLNDELSANHYSKPRLIDPSCNSLLLLD